MNSGTTDVRRRLTKIIRAPGTGCNPSLLPAARCCLDAGLSPDAAFHEIAEAIPHGGRVVRGTEIERAIKTAGGTAPRERSMPAQRPAIDRGYRERLIRRSDGAGEPDLWEASPMRIDWPVGDGRRDALAVLDALYSPEEKLFVGERHGTTVQTVSTWREAIQAHGPTMPHIIPNPLTGQPGQTKDGGTSYRADACVAAFRFCVVEFDDLDRHSQLAFWMSAVKILPVAVLIDSAGKSIHAWLRVDCPDVQAWERLVEGELYTRRLIPLGVDAACRNEARLSRLPGHLRVEKGKRQRLLYLNPRGTP